MSIETLGEAYRLSWRVRARCLRGTIETPVRLQRCDYTAELDMQTLVWAKGCKFAGNNDPLRGDIAFNSDPP
jgi:hypothetical protein